MRTSPRFEGAADELARGRKFSSDELKLLLLALLGAEPRHGYQLIQEIEARTIACYRPSAGIVYPALAGLEEAGLTQAVAVGKRKNYRLTDAGRRQVEAKRTEIEILWARLDLLGQKMALARRAFADSEAAARRETRAEAPTVMAAFEALKATVLAGPTGSAAEERRILAILERASREIGASAGDAGAAPEYP